MVKRTTEVGIRLHKSALGSVKLSSSVKIRRSLASVSLDAYEIICRDVDVIC